MECEILDVAKAGQLVDQTEQSPKSAFLTARKEQIYARAADRQIGSRVLAVHSRNSCINSVMNRVPVTARKGRVYKIELV